jgi:hypothetical protein
MYTQMNVVPLDTTLIRTMYYAPVSVEESVPFWNNDNQRVEVMQMSSVIYKPTYIGVPLTVCIDWFNRIASDVHGEWLDEQMKKFLYIPEEEVNTFYSEMQEGWNARVESWKDSVEFLTGFWMDNYRF